MKKLYDSGFFGRVLSVRLDFGWWVFDGELYPAQRPSWNYRKETGGGLVLDMFAHWRYVFDRLLGEIRSVSCRSRPHQRGAATRAAGLTRSMSRTTLSRSSSSRAAPAQISSSWASRVKRDDLLQIQVDGSRVRRCAGCTAASFSRLLQHQSRFLTPSGRRRWCSTNSGRKCPTSSRSAAATAPAGNCFCATSPRTGRSRRR